MEAQRRSDPIFAGDSSPSGSVAVFATDDPRSARQDDAARHDGDVDSIGGYRLVRRLGAGERAEVFLGHAGSAAAPRMAAIKVFRPSVPRSEIDLEIEALARASSPHLLRLDDLATAPDGRPVLVLARLQPTTLVGLLARRGRLQPGEAVTILAPVAVALDELHRVGVAHGNIGPRTILFDEAAAPVIVAFSRATLIGPMPDEQSHSSLTPATLGASVEAARDLADLVALARSVIECTPDSAARAKLVDRLQRHDPIAAPERFGTDLSDALFDFAEARAVDFAHPAQEHEPRSRRAVPIEAAEPQRRPDWLAALHLPDWLDGLAARIDLSRPRAFGARVRYILAPVRRPVWVAAGLAVVLLAAALVLVPAGADRPGEAVETLDGSGSTGSEGELKGGAEGGAGIEATSVSPDLRRAVLADDPVAAASALLALREVCLAEGSVLCLDGVDQPGSAAWEADGRAVRAEAIGSAAPIPADAAVTLLERMGNSALLDLAFPAPNSTPASILLVKGEAGWRIRDLILG